MPYPIYYCTIEISIKKIERKKVKVRSGMQSNISETEKYNNAEAYKINMPIVGFDDDLLRYYKNSIDGFLRILSLFKIIVPNRKSKIDEAKKMYEIKNITKIKQIGKTVY